MSVRRNFCKGGGASRKDALRIRRKGPPRGKMTHREKIAPPPTSRKNHPHEEKCPHLEKRAPPNGDTHAQCPLPTLRALMGTEL